VLLTILLFNYPFHAVVHLVAYYLCACVFHQWAMDFGSWWFNAGATWGSCSS